MRFSLLLAPIPALLGSFLLLQSVPAGTRLLIQQALIASIAGGICAFALWRVRGRHSCETRPWIAAIPLAFLILPLLLSRDDGPRRWISGGGFRLYLAALLLPVALLLLERSLQKALWPLWIAVGIGMALAAQPDASQVTAFSLSCLVLLWITRERSVGAWLTLLALAGCTVVAWRQPDPLHPVPYVEGVLEMARATGPLALIGALLALALLPSALIWQARATRRPGLVAVAIYYLAISCFAYAQLTPMPLLGFGASPILGYLAMAFLASTDSKKAV